MSVFAGGCDLPAFAVVCVDDDVAALDVLDELVRTSFVLADVTASPARYRLLKPIRQYARELLDASGEHGDRRRRHLDHYAGFARALHDGEDESGIVALDELLGELGNLRVALDWAAEEPEEPDVGLWLAGDLYDVWTAGFHHAEGVARLEGLLRTGRGSPEGRSAPPASPPSSPVTWVTEIGRWPSPCRRSTRRRAAPAAPRSATLAKCSPRSSATTATSRTPGGPLRRRCRGFEQTTDVDAFCLVTKVELDLVVGALDEAEATPRRVLTGGFGSLPWLGAAVRYVLGEIMLERGDVEHARSWLSEGLALGEAIGDSQSVVDAHLALVHIECAAGRFDEAVAHFSAAAQLTPVHNHDRDISFLGARVALALCGDSPGEAAGLAEAAVAGGPTTLSSTRTISVCAYVSLETFRCRPATLPGRWPRSSDWSLRPAGPLSVPGCRGPRGRGGGQQRPRPGACRQWPPRQGRRDQKAHGHPTSPQTGARPARQPLTPSRTADNGSD